MEYIRNEMVIAIVPKCMAETKSRVGRAKRGIGERRPTTLTLAKCSDRMGTNIGYREIYRMRVIPVGTLSTNEIKM